MNLDDEDIFDMCAAKGSSMDAFRKEFEDLQAGLETAKSQLISRSREAEQVNHELHNVKESESFTRRNIDELVSAQEGITDGNEHKRGVRNALSDREANNRAEIRSVGGLAEALKEQLSVGSDWSQDQLEVKQSLEKEKDFLSSKLENRMSQVNGVRADADRVYDQIQNVNKEIEDLELKAGDMDSKTEEYAIVRGLTCLCLELWLLLYTDVALGSPSLLPS